MENGTIKKGIDWNKRNSQNMRTWQVLVLWVGALSIMLFLLSGYAKMKLGWIRQDGTKMAEELFLTMKKGNNLPWDSNESKITAVIECGKKSIFLETSDSVGSEVAGCKYHMAKNIEVIFASKTFEPSGILKFQPKSSE